MKNKSLIVLLILFLGAGQHMMAIGQVKADMQIKFTTFLNEKGLFNKVDDDGDVQFQYEDKTYFIDIDEDDARFFQVVLPNIWPIESEAERMDVLRAMDKANREMKVAKMYMSKDNVWISMEIFQREVNDYEAYFDRCLRIIGRCIDNFKTTMTS